MIVLEAICLTVGLALAYCVHRREQRLSGPVERDRTDPSSGAPRRTRAAASPGPDRTESELTKRIHRALGGGKPRLSKHRP